MSRGESKVVGSKRAPAMNPWKQNPDPFFRSKSQFLEVFDFEFFNFPDAILHYLLCGGPNWTGIAMP
ncbi:MAG TPA: hypothetical protein VMW72_06670, partial [Sedimentisphaerales bacterium]|nr:hypothetical protein [Sedimentisphaerales bacterium]